MARPSTNTDLKLLEAGRRLVIEKGISQFSLRQVASLAGVNLGMFQYHFKSKEDFLRQVLQQPYEEFFATLESEFFKEDHKDSEQKLRSLLRILANFAYERRELLAVLVREGLQGEPLIYEFIGKNLPRHLGLLIQVIRDCQKKNLITRELEPLQVMFLCMSQLGLPVAAMTAVQKSSRHRLKNDFFEKMIGPDLIEFKIDFLMRGLKANGKKGAK